ncbi:MAG: hypothetical protein FWE16_02275 [Firmicutes bacterium]|nr:hypothetical protein [Bacillota bacterium]
MQKQYKIATGANLGNTGGSLMNAGIDTNNYVFTGSISNIFNDPKTKMNLVYSFFGNNNNERDEGFNDFIDNNPEYNQFLDSHRGEDGSIVGLPQEKRWHKLYEVAEKTFGAKFQTYMDNVKNQIHQEYAPMFEQLESLYENAKNEQVKPQPIQAKNGKADFGERPLLLHNIPLANKESLEARNDLGIIASEWFGKMESYGECRFCASFYKGKGNILDLEEHEKQKEQEKEVDGKVLIKLHTGGEKKKHPKMTYIIDPQTPAIEKLAKMDLWRYARNKESGNMDIYSQDEKQFLSKLYDWSAPKQDGETPQRLLGIAGNADGIAKDKPYWVAIPSGMPLKNVIALQVSDVDHSPELMQLVQQASEMHQVPIIDMAGKVIMGEQFLDKSNNQETDDELFKGMNIKGYGGYGGNTYPKEEIKEM